jgi:hypothetical protein
MVSTSDRLYGSPWGIPDREPLSHGRGAFACGACTPLAGGKNQCEWYPRLSSLADSWQYGSLPTHCAAMIGDVSILEVLCAHVPATLEAKTNVCVVCRVLHPSRVRVWQDGSTPLHLSSKNVCLSAVTWITDRLPYQVLERDTVGVCVCVCVCCEWLTGVGGQARHRMVRSGARPTTLHSAAPASCVSRPRSFIRGGRMTSTCSSVTI